MPALFVSGFLIFFVEVCLFGLLWLQNPAANLAAVIAHFALASLAAVWFSARWTNHHFSKAHMRLFILCLIGLLPVIGSICVFLIDNHRALRNYGVREGLGSNPNKKATPQDSLNYFSAPKQYADGNVRRTRDLISSIDDENYLGLLIASRHLPDKEAYSLLTEALFSPFESARLMAYSLRSKLEDKVTAKLENKQNALRSAKTKSQKLELHLSIAREYLRIIEIGIESQDKQTLVSMAKKHTINALKLDKQSSSAFRVLSKILRHEGHLNQAKTAERRAYTLAAA